MKKPTRIALIVCVLVIAIAIASGTLGCKSKTPHTTPTPRPSVAATATPTAEPTVTVNPDETITPGETPEATPTSVPTSTPSDTTPTPTSETTPVPTDTAQPTATPTQTSAPTATPTSAPTSVPSPTATPKLTPTPTQTPIPNTVYFQTTGNQQVGKNFSIQVLIYNTGYFTQGQFDIRFDSNIISYVSTSSTSVINGVSGTVSSALDPGTLGDNGLLRICPIDYADWAYQSNSGNGVTGSGYLCTITFSPLATGTTSLAFVSNQGNPAGKLELVKWISYVGSVITPVDWIDSSITVVN